MPNRRGTPAVERPLSDQGTLLICVAIDHVGDNCPVRVAKTRFKPVVLARPINLLALCEGSVCAAVYMTV